MVYRMIVVLDTETTGLPARGAQPEQTSLWPRLVSIAWSCVERKRCTGLNARIIKPCGYKIPTAASKVHGITTENARENGVDLESVFDALCNTIENASHVVCYNTGFDRGVLISEAIRTNHERATTLLNQKPWYCLMKKVMRHLQLKCFIKLEKAYGIICKNSTAQREPITFHRAEDDVKATVAIFLILFSKG